MNKVLILDAFRARRTLEQLHGKAFAFLDTNEKFAALRAEHADMQARVSRFSATNPAGFLNSTALELLRNQRVKGKSVGQIVEERRGDYNELPAYLVDGLARHGARLTTQQTHEHRIQGVLVDLRASGSVDKLYTAEGLHGWREMLIADADSLIVDPTDPRLTPSGKFYAFAFFKL
ncbi:hypothetical protein [Burkholderia ubonensis]|uniref:hypothetical protein n=1 Tax=Burkholderia ubonensis TaxID=101571 RepID=UPI000755EDAD|nr:hypothetical protein [Burkholderia ubonensis]KVD70136.1 hypothetical protein WI88_30845 [Burkholderia ubonensis]